MTLNEAIENGIPLAILTVDGGRRYMATAFIVPGGVVFLDTGWSETETMGGTNPIHMAEGKIKGSGPWTVGDNQIEEMLDGDPLAYEHNTWNQYLRGSDGMKNGTRQKAWANVMNSRIAEENIT